jgi:hypothetical protein
MPEDDQINSAEKQEGSEDEIESGGDGSETSFSMILRKNTSSKDDNIDGIITEYEECRKDIRATIKRRGLITTSAISAEALVLAYAFFGKTGSLLAISAVPVIIGATATILIAEDIRLERFEEHLTSIQDTYDHIFENEMPKSEKNSLKRPLSGSFSFITGIIYLILVFGIISMVLFYPEKVGIVKGVFFGMSYNKWMGYGMIVGYSLLTLIMGHALWKKHPDLPDRILSRFKIR